MGATVASRQLLRVIPVAQEVQCQPATTNQNGTDMDERTQHASKLFLAESRMTGMTEDQSQSLRRALVEAADRASTGEIVVSHLASAYIPSRGRWMCLFLATSSDEVRRVSEIAQIMFVSIQQVRGAHFTVIV